MVRSANRIKRDRKRSAKKQIQPRRRYDEKELDRAVDLWRNRLTNCLSTRDIFRVTNVPSRTFRRHSEEFVGPIGAPYRLPEWFEDELAECVYTFCKRGEAFSKASFQGFAREMLETVAELESNKPAAERRIPCLPKPDLFKASKNWMNGFMERNEFQWFETGRTKILGVQRRLAARPEIVEEWIDVFTKTMKEFEAALRDHLGKHDPEDSSFLEQDLPEAIFVMEKAGRLKKPVD